MKQQYCRTINPETEKVFIYPIHGIWRVEERSGDTLDYTVHDTLNEAIAYCKSLGREYEIC